MDILEKALAWAKEHHPDAPTEHSCAFANAVQEKCTGMSGGYGGPSAREMACSYAKGRTLGVEGGLTLLFLGIEDGRTLGIEGGLTILTILFPDGTLPMPGEWSFEQACKFCEPLCFGAITNLHFQCWRTMPTFNNSVEDLQTLSSFRQ